MAIWHAWKEGDGKRKGQGRKVRRSRRSHSVIDATRLLTGRHRKTRCPWRRLTEYISSLDWPKWMLNAWDFLIDEFPEVLGTCERAAALATTTARSGLKAFQCRPWLKGALYSAVALALTALAQTMFGNPSGSRFLYLLPIWFATRLSGRGVGFASVLAVSVLMAYSDQGEGHAFAFLEPNGLLRLGSLTALMLIISQVEGRLHSIQEAARRDPLTQVLNKAEIEHRVGEAIRLWQRRKVPVYVVMVDCDRFKSINDRYGHAFGDIVLRFLARRLQSAAKSNGMVGRVGGDEFLILFQGLNAVAVKRRMSSAAHTFEKYVSGMGLDASISCGIVEIGPGTDSLERALSSADQGMYLQKRAGRIEARPSGAYLTA